MKKCDFFKPELEYLGHLVSATGIKPDPAKMQTVSDWPQPRRVADVRQFLGLASYFRKFIRGYAATAAPLTDLLKGLSAHERTNARKLQRFPKKNVRRVVGLHRFQVVRGVRCCFCFYQNRIGVCSSSGAAGSVGSLYHGV